MNKDKDNYTELPERKHMYTTHANDIQVIQKSQIPKIFSNDKKCKFQNDRKCKF